MTIANHPQKSAVLGSQVDVVLPEGPCSQAPSTTSVYPDEWGPIASVWETSR